MYLPMIDFNTADGTLVLQAELDCDSNDESEEEINTNIAVARVDLIDKYNIEEV